MEKMSDLFNLSLKTTKAFAQAKQVKFYTAIIFYEGAGTCKLDHGDYVFDGPSILFATPYQRIQVSSSKNLKVGLLQFHGDFYCIEFHKADVACNGLLFNNVFLSPMVNLSGSDKEAIFNILMEIKKEFSSNPDRSVLIAYIQLFLAKCSQIKRKQLGPKGMTVSIDQAMKSFKQLIEEHYLVKHRPADYARMLDMEMNILSKKCKKTFGKTPTELIHERLIIEAKRKLHLTRQNIKEIAFGLNFKDEYYFSRFFKKSVGLSPLAFRKKVGISIVADLSMPAT